MSDYDADMLGVCQHKLTRAEDEIERLRIQNVNLKTALKRIRAIAWSDASSEELDDAQRDLRNIHFLANEALGGENELEQHEIRKRERIARESEY